MAAIATFGGSSARLDRSVCPSRLSAGRSVVYTYRPLLKSGKHCYKLLESVSDSESFVRLADISNVGVNITYLTLA